MSLILNDIPKSRTTHFHSLAYIQACIRVFPHLLNIGQPIIGSETCCTANPSTNPTSFVSGVGIHVVMHIILNPCHKMIVQPDSARILSCRPSSPGLSFSTMNKMQAGNVVCSKSDLILALLVVVPPKPPIIPA